MSLDCWNIWLAMAQPAAPGQQPSAPAWTGFMPLILLMVVFYFMLIRPQQKKAKEHESLLKTLKRGDKVLAGGGIVGVIVTVQDKTVTLRTSDSKLEVLKSAVSEIMERETEETPPVKSK